MNTKMTLGQVLLLVVLTISSCFAQGELEISTRLVVSSPEPLLVYEVRNSTDKPVKADKIGVGSSSIYTRNPQGTSAGSSIIVEWTEEPPGLPPGEAFRSIGAASSNLGCSVGLYIKWLRVIGVDTEKVAIYREPGLPCIDGRFDEDMDSIRVVTDLVQQGDFAVAQRQRRKEQLDAFEGMKQYVMVNPYILALSADGKPGFRLKLMATNNTQQMLVLPRPNTSKNRIEIVGPSEDRVRSYPNYTVSEDPTRNLELKVGETQSWTEDIGRYLKEEGIRLPGRYTVRWMVDEREVANFVFYLPKLGE